MKLRLEHKLSKGVFLISIDTELAWGFNHLPMSRHPNEQFLQVRVVIDRLLELMERYEIRATWAIVGHLFLDSCKEVDGRKHPEINPPQYSWLQRDWLEQDPNTSVDENPFRYGPDIVDKISSHSSSQEIGSHSFSHVFADDPDCTEEVFASELSECKRLAISKGIDLRSFVFPKNRVGQLENLSRFGFSSFRGSAPCWYEGMKRPMWSIAHKLDAFSPLSPPVSLPEKSEGVWNLPASYYYPPKENWWGRLLPIWTRVLKSRLALKRAAKQKRIFHIWFHPYNLATDIDCLFYGLEKIFAEVSLLRSQGVLENPTMGELSAALDVEERQMSFVS